MLIIFILTKCIKTTCHVFQDLQSWVMKEKIGNPSNGERQNMMRWSCESEGEIWSVIALGFIFVDKVPLWWIHQRGISHEPKDGDDVHQSITFIYLQGQRGQEEWCTFQYHFNCRYLGKIFFSLCEIHQYSHSLPVPIKLDKQRFFVQPKSSLPWLMDFVQGILRHLKLYSVDIWVTFIMHFVTSNIFMSGRNFSMRVSMTALFVAVLETRIHLVATWENNWMRYKDFWSLLVQTKYHTSSHFACFFLPMPQFGELSCTLLSEVDGGHLSALISFLNLWAKLSHYPTTNCSAFEVLG